MAAAATGPEATHIDRLQLPADVTLVKDGALVQLLAESRNRADATVAAERAQVAQWARDHDLTGLSPESLQPIHR